MTSPEAQWTAHRDRFEAALTATICTWDKWPKHLQDPCAYVLSAGGKRVRPVLVLMAAEAAGGAAVDAMPWALALELVHNYSLIHDDLPCMDDDDLRRGRPTCHKVYGEALGVLAGDALLTEAFGVIARAGWPAELKSRLTALLAESAGGLGMVGGQVLDIEPDGIGSLDDLERMQGMKTGALFHAAVVGGALASGAEPPKVSALSAYGRALGLLFQVTDDLLDREQDAERGGNNYLHHLKNAEVFAKRDETAAAARAALEPFGAAASDLVTVVDFIAHRKV